MAAGRGNEATASLAKAADLIQQTGSRWWEAELHRMRGFCLLSRSTAAAQAAEAGFRTAIDVARSRWELRAAHNLASLWAEQGERQKAHDLLAPVYDWFTEGFDTPDLKEAKALLDQLA